MKTRITLFNNIVSRNNQYSKDSSLYFSIIEAYGMLEKPQYVDEDEAKEKAAEFCNVISLYAVAFASGGISVSLEEFIKFGIDNKYIRSRDGFIFSGCKQKILAGLGLNIDMEYVEHYENLSNPEVMEDDTFYQMKIRSRSGAYHFIGCYYTDGVLYLSDTSNRGIGVPVYDKIAKKDFFWLLKIA